MYIVELFLNSTIRIGFINCFPTIVCNDSMFFCHHGRVNEEQPACISNDQRCDGTIDCIGGEDELDHNCPCGPEGAVRLVDGIVSHRGRVECAYFVKVWPFYNMAKTNTQRYRL